MSRTLAAALIILLSGCEEPHTAEGSCFYRIVMSDTDFHSQSSDPIMPIYFEGIKQYEAELIDNSPIIRGKQIVFEEQCEYEVVQSKVRAVFDDADVYLNLEVIDFEDYQSEFDRASRPR